MNKTIGALVAIVVLAAGALWYIQSRSATSADMSSSTAPVVQTSSQQQNTPGPSASQAVVADHIAGTWKSESDPKNVIELTSNAKIVWRYDGSKVAEGLYVIFTKGIAPKLVPFTMDESAVYMQTTETGGAEDTQNFRVDLSADTNTLTMTYMDRGGATVYTRVQ